jgi:hypothetical protein
MTTAKLTEKQRRGMEAFEAARKAGVPLSEYAKSQGLEARELYDAIARLRKGGLLPATERPHRDRRAFVAVKVVRSAPRNMDAARVAPRGGMVCRLVHAGGFVIECGEWPPPTWIAALRRECRDAAP